ncbi:MAG: transglutaminase domain-containing protein [Bacteroidales bacterium]|nr:transglutaminase domain-containing protein [Bacteroidales bacterium]
MKKGLVFGLIGGALGLLYLWSKKSSVTNMIDKLTITPRLGGSLKLDAGSTTTSNKIGKFLQKVVNYVTDSAYVVVPINVDFANRSSQEMKISVQSVMAYIGEAMVASSVPAVSSVVVKANAVSTLEGIKMQIGTRTLLSIFGTNIQDWLTKGNFDNITKDLKIKIGAILNDAFTFDIMLDLGKSGQVDTTGAVTISGLGLTAASKRTIRPLSDYISLIPEKTNLRHHDYIVKANGSVVDTANIMHQAASADVESVRRLAQSLQRDTLTATLQSIFDFVYTHIQYELDSRFTEQVRRPLRALYDQKGDCDCFATLIGSMLEALNIPYKFRIAAYSAGRFQHVYVIVPTTDNVRGYYVVDPVLDKCFDEKPTTKFLDV